MFLQAGININPVAGLQHFFRLPVIDGRTVAGININPVAGLQPTLIHDWTDKNDAGININPVAGLQLQFGSVGVQCDQCRNQHQPSRGITTFSCRICQPLRRRRNQHQPSRGITTAHECECSRKVSRPESTSTQSRDYNWIDSI